MRAKSIAESTEESEGAKHMLFTSLAKIPEAKPDDDIDVKPLLEDARSDAQTKTELSQDTSWAAIAVLGMEALTVTDIDGKYEFKNVKGGEYYIFASYSTECSYVDWLVPVSVSSPDAMKNDLHNATARCIKNKNDD